jgi:[ribosomal protein S18]-alanine N-acetyltransferase
MKISLRSYSSSDFDALYEIDQVCYERGLAYSKPELRSYLSLPGGDCVIAEVAERISGFLISARENIHGYIVTIDVLEAYRRQGVATKMLTEAERRLLAAGAHKVELETATDNASGIAFWKKHGYRVRGIKKHYYPNGVDALHMTKSLEEA